MAFSYKGYKTKKNPISVGFFFVSMEMDGLITFEIEPKEPFENVIIRPLSLGIEPEITENIRLIAAE